MNLSYHDIRHKLISHISELEGFAKEIESEMVDVRAQLPSDRPIVISLVGDRDAGMHQVVGRTLALDIPERGEGCDYHCIHYPDCPPILLEGIPDVNFSTHDSDALKKWIMVEYYTKPVTGLAPVNEVVNKSDAIVFVVDARDPWSGRIWNHFENYVKSHQGRIFFFLNRLEKIDQRDWSILKKHLEEKILQVAGYSIKIKLSEDDSSFIDLCDALDSTEINRVKWDELKPMTMVLTQAMGDIEATLQENLIWQANAASFSEELDSDLSKLNQQLDSRMEHSIEEAGKSLSERATEIVAGVRKTFTNRAYFRSFVKNSVSLDSFYSNLEKVVSETLYRELTGCYSLINSCVTKHARDFKEDYKQLALQLTKFQGEFDNINVPFILCKDDVQQEVHKTMLEWDVKKIFEEQLAAIDRVANFRIKIALVLMIAAGLLLCGYEKGRLNDFVISCMNGSLGSVPECKSPLNI